MKQLAQKFERLLIDTGLNWLASADVPARIDLCYRFGYPAVY